MPREPGQITGERPKNYIAEADGSLPDTSKVPPMEATVVPPEFARRYTLKSAPDRFGVMGLVSFIVDTRPSNVNVSYFGVPLGPDGEQYFLDDHLRSFNDQLAQGGRDMRGFKQVNEPVKDREAKERISHIDAEIHRVLDILKKRLKPILIGLEETVNRRTETRRDYEGDMQIETTATPTLTWKNNNEQLLTLRASFDSSGVTQIANFTQQAQAEGNQKMTIYLREQLAQLKAAEDSEEVISLKNQLQSAIDELGAYKGSYSVRIPIYLTKHTASEELDQLIAKAQQDPYNRPSGAYNRAPNHYGQALGELGTAATMRWYSLQDVDLEADVINFPKAHIDSGSPSFASLERAKLKGAENRARQEAENAQLQLKEARKNAEQARLTALQAHRAEIKTELTPENRALIETKMQALGALIDILKNAPAATTEQQKIINSLPSGTYINMQNNYLNSSKGLELIKEADQLLATLKQYATRKSTLQAFPDYWDRAQKLVEAWQAIPERVNLHDEAQMVIEENYITQRALAENVSRQFLSKPWEASLDQIISAQVAAIVENIAT